MTLPQGYWIRPFEPDDAPSLSGITLASIRQLGLRHYSQEQVAAWAGRHPSSQRFIDRAVSGATILVAVTKAPAPVAYTLVEIDGEGAAPFDMLYCHRQHTRQGIADALLAAAEDHARAKGAPRIYTEASELARAVFERSGYALLNKRDFTIEHEGRAVAIHNYAMEKRFN